MNKSLGIILLVLSGLALIATAFLWAGQSTPGVTLGAVVTLSSGITGLQLLRRSK